MTTTGDKEMDSLLLFGARTMRRAARSLEKWAKIIRDSDIVRVPGHPRYMKFDDDEDGRAGQKEYENMMADAKILREMAKAYEC